MVYVRFPVRIDKNKKGPSANLGLMNPGRGPFSNIEYHALAALSRGPCGQKHPGQTGVFFYFFFTPLSIYYCLLSFSCCLVFTA